MDELENTYILYIGYTKCNKELHKRRHFCSNDTTFPKAHSKNSGEKTTRQRKLVHLISACIRKLPRSKMKMLWKLLYIYWKQRSLKTTKKICSRFVVQVESRKIGENIQCSVHSCRCYCCYCCCFCCCFCFWNTRSMENWWSIRCIGQSNNVSHPNRFVKYTTVYTHKCCCRATRAAINYWKVFSEPDILNNRGKMKTHSLVSKTISNWFSNEHNQLNEGTKQRRRKNLC